MCYWKLRQRDGGDAAHNRGFPRKLLKQGQINLVFTALVRLPGIPDVVDQRPCHQDGDEQ